MKKYLASATAMIAVLAAALSCHGQVVVERDLGTQCGGHGYFGRWFAVVRKKGGRGYITGGVLISPKQVLIMGYGMRPRNKGALPAAGNLEVDFDVGVKLVPSFINVTDVTWHPDMWSQSTPFAILTLEDPVHNPAGCIMNKDKMNALRLDSYRDKIKVLALSPAYYLRLQDYLLTTDIDFGSFNARKIPGIKYEGFAPALAVVVQGGSYAVVGFRTFHVVNAYKNEFVFLTVSKQVEAWVTAKRPS